LLEPAPPPTNTMAIVGLIVAFIFAPVGLALSLIALKETKGTADRTGYSLSIAGTVVSAIQVVIGILVILLYVGVALVMMASIIAGETA